jgi:hypothetical protein
MLSVTARRRQARGANQVIRRFMKDLLQTAATRLVEFVSSEYRGTLADYRYERQLDLFIRKICRWYYTHP